MSAPAGAPELVDSRLELTDRVATLTLDRDDVRNELTGTRLSAEIAAVADWADAAEEVSVLVITGAGRSFCAGGNVKDMAERSGAFAGDPYELQRRYGLGIQRMTVALHRAGLPTIAAVNGAAIGAGFDLTCMCDVRVAARGAKMGETFVNLGIIPGDGGAWLLQRLVGYERAAELTLTGRVFDADEALAMGVVSTVVEPGELAERAAALAATMAAKPPRALRLTKRLLKSAQRMEMEDFLDLSASYQAISHHNPEHHEAIDAFVNAKRKP
jgi:enoyl-CoA hydratase/carnithine racemase